MKLFYIFGLVIVLLFFIIFVKLDMSVSYFLKYGYHVSVKFEELENRIKRLENER